MRSAWSKFFLALFIVYSAETSAKPFLGIGGSMTSFDDGFDHVDTLNITFRAGYALNSRFELLGEISRSVVPDSIGTVDFDVDSESLFLQMNLSTRSGRIFYFLLGATNITLSSSGGIDNSKRQDSDTGWGFGYRIPIDSSGSNILIDYIRYYDDDRYDNVVTDVDVEAFNLIYFHSF